MRSPTDAAPRGHARHSVPGRCTVALLLAGAILAIVSTAAPQSTTTQPADANTPAAPEPAKPATTDADVRQAIARGVEFLKENQTDDGTWPSAQAGPFSGGIESLAALAMLRCGADPNDRQVKQAITAATRTEPDSVYARSYRTLLLAHLASREKTHRKQLQADTAWLCKQMNVKSGGWGYGPSHATSIQDKTYVDTFHTQLALHALHAASAAGEEIPSMIWRRARSFWTQSQNEDGGWGFMPPGTRSFRVKPTSYGTTVAAGIASLHVLSSQWVSSERSSAESPPEKKPAVAAMAWMNKSFSADEVPEYIWGDEGVEYFYYVEALTRTSHRAGVRNWGKTDWYPALVRVLLGRQFTDGGWATVEPAGRKRAARLDKAADAPLCTALALLALERASRPVLINRINTRGKWDGTFRDAAIAADYCTRDPNGWPVGWQWVSLDHPQHIVDEAPLLWLDAAGSLTLDEKASARLAAQVRSGGLLVIQGKPDDQTFNRQIADYLQNLLPQTDQAPLPAGHALWKLTDLQSGDSRPDLVGFDDGCRLRAVIATSDLSGRIERRDPTALATVKALAMYATDMRKPEGRLARRKSPDPIAKVDRSLAIGRVKHSGNWDCCPGAAGELHRALVSAVSIGVREVEVDLAKPAPDGLHLLWLTGTEGSLTAAQKTNLRKFVLAGGTLLADPATGSEKRLGELRDLLEELFGADAIKPVPARHGVLTGKVAGGMGASLQDVSFSRSVTEKTLELQGIRVGRRLAVVLCPVGVSCPAQGHPTFGARTLSPVDARKLAINVLLHATATESE